MQDVIATSTNFTIGNQVYADVSGTFTGGAIIVNGGTVVLAGQYLFFPIYSLLLFSSPTFKCSSILY